MWLSHHTTEVPTVTMDCVAAFGQGQHSSVPIIIISRLNHIRSSKIKSLIQKDEISIYRENPSECEDAAARPHPNTKKNYFPSIETTLDKVCRFRRGLLQWRLNGELIYVVDIFYSTKPRTF